GSFFLMRIPTAAWKSLAKALGFPTFTTGPTAAMQFNDQDPFTLRTIRGGRAIKKISRSIRRAPRSASAPARSLKRGRGGFPIRTEGKPPRLRQLRWLREIFLMTQTPLLAVMQGGESRSIPIFSQLL